LLKPTTILHDTQNFQKPRSRLKILGTRRVIRSKFRTENPQISGASAQNFVATVAWRPRFVHPCYSSFTAQNMSLRQPIMPGAKIPGTI